MVQSTTQMFTDLDAYQAKIQGARVDSIITSRGSFRVKRTAIWFDQLKIQRSEETLSRVAHHIIEPDLFAIVFATNSTQPSAYLRGLELCPTDMIVFAAGSEGYNRVPAPHNWGAMSVEQGKFDASCKALIGREFTASAITQRIRPDAPVLMRLSDLHKAAGLIAESTPEILQVPEVARALEHALSDAMIACVANGLGAETRKAECHRESVVRRLEEFLEANLDRTIYLQELCKAVGATSSTLRNYCYEQLGMSPKRYLWLRRMHLARRALRAADPVAATVTGIATNYGFWELGRFSVVYRSLFGEPPSTSLRRPADGQREAVVGPPWPC